ncbi:MAG: VanW family protein [Cytophagales bacterium]|nr:VanW family protein [Armatimonadota bacterium]
MNPFFYPYMRRAVFLLALPTLLIPGRTRAQAPTPAPTVAAAGPSLSYPITLTDGVRSVVRTRRELGIRVGSDGKLTADVGAMKGVLARLAPRFLQEAVNAKPSVYRGAVRIVPGAYARALNVPITAQRLADAVAKDPATKAFTVSFSKKPPLLTAERLKSINGVLGTMRTTTSANAKRNNNIKVAAESIDGTLLSPGEVFSLNKTVGKRTQARGYLTATVFVDAEKVPGIGGGVSQVTGTLFNAAALAGLAIQEVNPHSRPVAYLPIGRDATVAYGSKDLKFANNTKAPVYIAYTFDGSRLHATLFGAKTTGRTVTLRPAVQRLGAGRVNAALYRIVKQNGKVTAKQRLFRHQYRWTPE